MQVKTATIRFIKFHSSTTWNHFHVFLTILITSKSFWIILIHSESFSSIPSHSQPFAAIPNPFATIPNPFRAIPNPFQPIRNHSQSIRSHSEPFKWPWMSFFLLEYISWWFQLEFQLEFHFRSFSSMTSNRNKSTVNRNMM